MTEPNWHLLSTGELESIAQYDSRPTRRERARRELESRPAMFRQAEAAGFEILARYPEQVQAVSGMLARPGAPPTLAASTAGRRGLAALLSIAWLEGRQAGGEDARRTIGELLERWGS